MRIYKKNKAKFLEKEFQELENVFLNSPYLTPKGFISRFVPIIFSLTNDNTSIESQFNIYNYSNVWDNLERIYETNIDKYDFWFIKNTDVVGVDWIGHFNFKKNSNGQIDGVINWENSVYRFDKIKVYTPDEITNRLNHIDWVIKENFAESKNYFGEYNSSSERYFISNETDYKLTPISGRIPLNKKYSFSEGGIIPTSITEPWYSDKKLELYISKEFKTKRIEFFFQNRLTRLIDSKQCNFDELIMLDGWDNCVNSKYLNYLKNFTTK